MEHLLLKATATPTTDLGEFEAVISSESVDREKDVISAAAMVKAVRKWTRPIPLTWHHSTKAEDVFGHVDPDSAREVNAEVVVAGKVDLESPRGREAWRLMKARTLGFSFHALIPQSGVTKRTGGGLHVSELDVIEITGTVAPMNADTRVLATKAIDEHDLIRTKARDEMFALLTADPDPVVTKSIDLPVQIASFDC